MNTEQIGRMVKAEYPVYRKYSDEEIGQKILARYSDFQSADGLLATAENSIKAHTAPSTTVMMNVLATGIMLASLWFFYNANQFEGYNAFAIFVMSIVGFIGSIYIFQTAYKNRRSEYEFAKTKIQDNYALASQHQAFLKALANRSVEEEERQTKIAQFQTEQALLLIRLRNEMLITDAANRELLDPQTYTNIREMQASSNIENRKYWERILYDESHIRELKRLELEAKQIEANLAIEMTAVKRLAEFNEFSILNRQLANLYLELETAEAMPESHRKIQELQRITNQMKTWEKTLRGRKRQLH